LAGVAAFAERGKMREIEERGGHMEPQKENPLSEIVLAEDSEQGAGGVSGLPARIARYEKARQRALSMESFARNAGHVKVADKLDGCGNYLLFRHYFTVDTVRLHAATFCKQHLLCPLCAIRRGAKLLKAYLERFLWVSDSHKNWSPYLVTFTVQNGDDLAERFKHLQKSIQVLNKRRHRDMDTEVKKAHAAVWSYEVTNKGNGWHPHVHAVWLCSSEPDQAKLREEWKDITGDSFMVDVRPLSGDPVDGFCEVFKYAVKFSELSEDDAFSAYETLCGKRLVGSFGEFRNLEIPEEYTDAELSDDLPFMDMLYRFVRSPQGGHYSYVPVDQDRNRQPNVIKLPSASRGPVGVVVKSFRPKWGMEVDSAGRRYWYSFFSEESRELPARAERGTSGASAGNSRDMSEVGS
jgi:hypothetical protein